MPHCGCHHKKHNYCENEIYDHCHHHSQYPGVQNLLGQCEKVLFTGTYDRGNWGLTPTSTDDNNVGTNFINLSLNTIGYTSVTVTTLFNKAKPLGSPSFYTENYYIPSFNSDLSTKLGEVNIQGSYPETGNAGGITTGGIQSFDVSSRSGIFHHVNRVIIDFNNPIRVLYFIGKY